MELAEHSILFIDDEANILNAIKRLLRHEPWGIHCVTRAQEAFALLKQIPIQVVVTDQRMPEMAGIDFLSSLREQRPEIVRMMMTGFSETPVAIDAINRGEVFRFITKPWNDEEFKATLRQAFDHFDLRSEIKRLGQIARDQNRKLQDMNRSLESKVRDRTKHLTEQHQELRTAFVQIIGTLAEAIDAKDPFTQGHSERVAVYAAKLGRELGMPRHEIERVYISALLHDIGKIGIPEAIAAKPESLDEAEYELMKRHPEIGAKILEAVPFLADIVPCVRHHHEWFDGADRGYPARFRGDRIPFPSRVILVADAVEAMSSDRSYRSALGLNAVMRELHQFSGSQFDPNCAAAMVRLLEREGEQFLRQDAAFHIYEFIGGPG